MHVVLLDNQRSADLAGLGFAEAIAGLSCCVVVALFFVQRYGTGRIGTAFSPVLTLWFVSNAAIGIYNIAR